MSEGIRSTREVAGYSADRIRIGSLYSLTNRTVPALVMGMKLRKPDLQTELVLGSNADLLQKLRDGAVDAALMGTPEGAADVESEPLFEDDIYFAAPVGSRYAALEQIDLAACAEERFVSLERRLRHLQRIHGILSRRRLHAECRDEDRRHLLADEPGERRRSAARCCQVACAA